MRIAFANFSQFKRLVWNCMGVLMPILHMKHKGAFIMDFRRSIMKHN